MKTRLPLVMSLAATLLCPGLRAEEGGSGHYLPGATASFIDALPGKEAFVYVNDLAWYSGSASGTRQLRLGGNVAASLDATVVADTSIVLYQTPWKVFGGEYAAAMAIPYVWMEVKGKVQPGSILPPGSRSEKTDGLGDIQILPFMVGWTRCDVKLRTQLGIYAPTGDFEAGRLANIGKNYWTFEPGFHFSWLSSKKGTEVTVFAAFDFSTKNGATDYQSGDVFHVDATTAKHFPVGHGLFGVGAGAFWYEQISGDSGSGATLGSLEGRSFGVGPVLSYMRQAGKRTTLIGELKWLPDLDAEKRLEGDVVWFKLALVF